MRTLYPEIEPYATHWLEVDRPHRIYAEECGNPEGLPVLFLHGGPGSGCRPYHRCYFDPAAYRIVLLDQRGSGRSAPAGQLENNTTGHLLDDLERLRKKLNIDRWVLFGGSWGAALGLLYAQAHAERVAGMILRGSFLARRRDVDWFIADGANRIYPERWAELMKFLPEHRSDDPVQAFHDVLTGSDELATLRLAKAWNNWGAQLTLGEAFDPAEVERRSVASLIHQAAIELHYARHRYFIEDNQILQHGGRLPQVPTILVHGRNDLVCPAEAALALKERIPGADLRILPRAGHVGSTPDMVDALVTASDEMLTRIPR